MPTCIAELYASEARVLLCTVVDSPGACGFASITDACVDDPTHLCVLYSVDGGNAAGYPFRDGVRPALNAHAPLTDQFSDTVAPRDVEATLQPPAMSDWFDRIRDERGERSPNW